MTSWIWKKLNIFTFGIAALVLFGLLIFLANIEIKDLDLWLHLATGRYILENFSIPKVDVLSATIVGQNWINHEWLFQTIVAFIHQMAGFDGLISLQVVVVGVTFALLLSLGYNPKRPWMSIGLLLLVLLVYQHRFTIRPDIFSLLFFVLYIKTLGQNLNQKKSLLVLFVLQILWSNIHGFFILGPMLVLLNLAGEWGKRHLRLPFEWNQAARLNDQEYKYLKWALGVVLVACLFNPHFLQGAWYPFSVLFSLSNDHNIFFKHIKELRPPFTLATAFSWNVYPYFKFLIILSAGSFAINWRKVDIGVFIFWVAFLLFSMSAVRNIVFFSFAAYFVILANTQVFQFNKLERLKKFKNIFSIIFNVLLILWMVQYAERMSYRGYYDFDKFERKSEFGGISQRNFPYKAVDFLKDNKIKGRFFNDFNSGAYLIGRTFPDIKVFIDGRTEAYGPKYFQDYQKIWKDGDTDLFDETVKKYDLTGVFLNSVYAPAPKKLIRYLYESKEWSLVYFDYDASIFLKNIPENEIFIKKSIIDISEWKTRSVDLFKIRLMRVTPYRHVYRAYALYNMGFSDKAEQELAEVLRMDTSNFRAYKLLGKIYSERDDKDLAFEYLRKAKLLNSRDKGVREQLENILKERGSHE